MRSFIWLVIFSISAPAALISSFLFLVLLNPKTDPAPVHSPNLISAYNRIYQPQTQIISEQSTQVGTSDARPWIIKSYLAKYSSELEPHYQEIVDISDENNLDYRLLVAIAQQESNLCKKIPENSFNCWGFGIYGDKVTRFPSYSDALNVVARTLKKEYLDKGLDTPEKIMAKYTPPSQGSWAAGVNQFLSEME
jgi:hypothetical protein